MRVGFHFARCLDSQKPLFDDEDLSMLPEEIWHPESAGTATGIPLEPPSKESGEAMEESEDSQEDSKSHSKEAWTGKDADKRAGKNVGFEPHREAQTLQAPEVFVFSSHQAAQKRMWSNVSILIIDSASLCVLFRLCDASLGTNRKHSRDFHVPSLFSIGRGLSIGSSSTKAKHNECWCLCKIGTGNGVSYAREGALHLL